MEKGFICAGIESGVIYRVQGPTGRVKQSILSNHISSTPHVAGVFSVSSLAVTKLQMAGVNAILLNGSKTALLSASAPKTLQLHMSNPKPRSCNKKSCECGIGSQAPACQKQYPDSQSCCKWPSVCSRVKLECHKRIVSSAGQATQRAGRDFLSLSQLCHKQLVACCHNAVYKHPQPKLTGLQRSCLRQHSCSFEVSVQLQKRRTGPAAAKNAITAAAVISSVTAPCNLSSSSAMLRFAAWQLWQRRRKH